MQVALKVLQLLLLVLQLRQDAESRSSLTPIVTLATVKDSSIMLTSSLITTNASSSLHFSVQPKTSRPALTTPVSFSTVTYKNRERQQIT